jgi:predicted nucleic acid-binding protein
MIVLLDTNILGRMVEVGHPQHQAALDSSDALGKRGDVPSIVPQVLYELWVVATRPITANGFGLTPTQAAAEMARLQALFPLLPDTPAIFPEWQRLVLAHQVSGKNAHDARLVAAMTTHGVTHILTFNTGDFARYAGITALDPAAIGRSPPASSP